MPFLRELIPDPEVLTALEPDELGLRMLPALISRPAHDPLSLFSFLRSLGEERSAGAYPPRGRHEVERAVREAWAWLEGQGLLIEHPGYLSPNSERILSRRAIQLAKEPDARRIFSARRIAKETLHPGIREDVWALYHRGRYETAVFEAMKAVEVAVREASGLPAKEIGTNLMRQAFDPQTGSLTDMTAEKAEREARSALFAGAIGSYKNPHSHRYVALEDPDEAAEIIMLANHLLRIVDSRKAAQL